MLGEVDICLIDEDEHGAITGIFGLQIFVDVVEGVACFVEVGGGRKDVNKGRRILKYHLFVGRRLVNVVLGWEIVQFELDLLYFEVVGLHLRGLA